MAISAFDPVQPRPAAEPLSSAPKAGAVESETPPETGGHAKAFAGDEFSFWDLVDVINPLQHIPVVSTLYRHLTGDEIGFVAKLAGAALLGGPIGLAGSFVDVAIEDNSGRDIGEHLYALVTGDDGEPGETALAKNETQPEITTAAGAGTEITSAAGTEITSAAGTAGAPAELMAAPPLPAAPLPAPMAEASSPMNRPLFGLPPQVAQQMAAVEPPPAATVGPPTPVTPPMTAMRPVASRGEPAFKPLPQRGVPSPGPRMAQESQRALLAAQGAPDASSAPAPLPSLAGAPSAWFGAAMNSALGKYEQARQLQTP